MLMAEMLYLKPCVGLKALQAHFLEVLVFGHLALVFVFVFVLLPVVLA